MYQCKHTADVFIIHSCKCLIQRNHTRMVFLFCFFILRIDCRKERDIHCHRFFSATETVKRRIGQHLPGLPATPVKHMEFKPFPVIQRIPHKIHIVDCCVRFFQPHFFCAYFISEMFGYLLDIFHCQKHTVTKQYLF